MTAIHLIDLASAAIAAEHPDWSGEQVMGELKRLADNFAATISVVGVLVAAKTESA